MLKSSRCSALRSKSYTETDFAKDSGERRLNRD